MEVNNWHDVFCVNSPVLWYHIAMIAGAIVKLRERASLSQSGLAKRLGMKRSQSCVLEKGGTVPSSATVARIAAAFEMTASAFMEVARKMDAGTDLLPIRSSCAVLAEECLDLATRDAAVSAQEEASGIASATTLPFHHAYLMRPHAAEILAGSLRTALRVGMSAFSDLVWTLEFANVRIYKHALPSAVRSAGWWNPKCETLVIALNDTTTPERQIYHLAYELGAACLFRSAGNKAVRETARERRFLSEFAADFLMPAATVADMVAKVGIRPDAWRLSQLLAFKAHFGVSAETFAFRLEELGLISKPLRHQFRTELRAYYKKHPDAMEPEPRLRPLNCGVRVRILGERGPYE